MRWLFSLLLSVVSVASFGGEAMAETGLYGFTVNSIDGTPTGLESFKGKVLLIVNVASNCGFTPQYEGLQKLYDEYREQGLVVLGFPSNDFGQQEPGSESEIKKFCSNTYGVTFPLFSKTKVVGSEQDPLYAFLTSSIGGGAVGWNFEKFLVDRSGKVVHRFRSSVRPLDAELRHAVESALDASNPG